MKHFQLTFIYFVKRKRTHKFYFPFKMKHAIFEINKKKLNQEQTIKRNWQHCAHKTQDKDKQNKKHNTVN